MSGSGGGLQGRLLCWVRPSIGASSCLMKAFGGDGAGISELRATPQPPTAQHRHSASHCAPTMTAAPLIRL